MTPVQFVNWKAFRRIQPDPMDRLCEIVKRGFARVCAIMGDDVSPDVFDPCVDKHEPEHVAGPGEAKQILGPLMGASSGNSNR